MLVFYKRYLIRDVEEQRMEMERLMIGEVPDYHSFTEEEKK